MEGTTNYQPEDTSGKRATSPDLPDQPDSGMDRDIERDYGDYRDTDEGDSSVRAGAYDKGREPVQPSPGDQSGSTGRPTGNGDPADQGADSGQGRYGQTGFGGAQPETTGQQRYRASEADGNEETKGRSNAGSGSVEHEDAEYKRNEGAKPPQKEDRDAE